MRSLAPFTRLTVRVLVLSALGAAMAGCAGIDHVQRHYSGMMPTEVVMPEDTYRVFDKPAEGRIMVTPSIGAAAAQGFTSGLVFNAIDTTPPLPNFRAAAERHLSTTGRAHCTITEGYLVIRPQYEFRYRCGPLTPPAAPVGTIR